MLQLALDLLTPMTRLEIAVLACRVLALWMFAQVAIAAPSLAFLLAMAIHNAFGSLEYRWDELIVVAHMTLPTVGVLVVGLLFWYRAGRLARRMVSDDPTPVTRPDLTRDDVLAIAFTATGVFTLVPVLRELAGSVIPMVRGDYPSSQWWSNAGWQASFWSSIVGLAWSLWLIFGARSIARFVRWARDVAPRKDDHPTEG